MSADFEVQKTIYNVLTAGLTVDVYSMGNVTQDIEAVFVVIGSATLIPHDADGQTGFEVTIVIDTWDNVETSKGFGQIKPVMGEIYDLINRADLTVTGYKVLDSMFDFQQSFIDRDGITAHGVQRFRIILTTE